MHKFGHHSQKSTLKSPEMAEASRRLFSILSDQFDVPCEQLYSEYLKVSMDMRVSLHTVGSASGTDAKLALKLLGDGTAAPRFFNALDYFNCCQLEKSLPGSVRLRIYIVPPTARLNRNYPPAKLFDNVGLGMIKGYPPATRLVNLLYYSDSKTIELAAGDELEAFDPLEFEAHLAECISPPAASPLEAVSWLLETISGRGISDLYEDFNHLLKSPSRASELTGENFLLLYHKGARSKFREFKEMNALLLAQGGSSRQDTRYIFVTCSPASGNFHAYLPHPKFLPDIVESALSPRSPLKDSHRFTSDGCLQPKKPPEPPPPPAEACGCGLCVEARAKFGTNVSGDVQKRYRYKDSAVDYFKLLGFEEYLPLLEECFDLSCGSIDCESISKTEEDAGMNFPTLSETRCPTGAVGWQHCAYLGFVWNFKSTTDMSTDIFDLSVDAESEMSRFVECVLKVREEAEAKKRKLLEPVFAKLRAMREAHFEYFASQKEYVGGESAKICFEKTIFQKCWRHLQTFCGKYFVTAVNGTGYDFPLIARSLRSGFEAAGRSLRVNGTRDSDARISKMTCSLREGGKIVFFDLSSLLPPGTSLAKLSSTLGLKDSKMSFPFSFIDR